MGLDRNFVETIATSNAKWVGIVIVVISVAATSGFFLRPTPDVSSSIGGTVTSIVPVVKSDQQILRDIVGTNVLDSDGRPRRSSDTSSLAKVLQSRLSQNRCYNGLINGIWTAESKDAMRRFVAAANAHLLVDAPDDVLLALAETNPKVVCSDTQSASAEAALAHPTDSDKLDRQPGSSVEPPTPPPSDTSSANISNEAAAKISPAADSSKAVVRSIQLESPGETISPSDKSSAPVERRVRSSAANRHSHSAAQSKTRYKIPTAVDTVAKSVTKSVKSLKRTLANLFD